MIGFIPFPSETFGQKKKKIDDNAPGSSAKRCDWEILCVKKEGRGLASSEDCVDITIQWLERLDEK